MPAPPDESTLLRFHLGLLPAADLDAVARHLDAHPEAASTLNALAAGDTLLGVLPSVPAHDAPETPELSAAVGRALGLIAPPGDAPAAGPLTATAAGAAAPGHRLDPDLTPLLAPPEQPGELGRIDAYRVLRVLGRGGMGVVFEAEDTRLGRSVALKVMLPGAAADPAAKARFLREGRAAAAVEHDHIIPVYQIGEGVGIPFLAMPLLVGESLADRLRDAAPLPPAAVIRVGREVAEGLAAAHASGLIHRDIKPSNVWLERTPDGGFRRARILDFGLARPARGGVGLTDPGTVLGTPAYMAPEQARGLPVDHRADLFSLGCVVYQMATGRRPFPGADTFAVLTALATDTPPPPAAVNPGVPPALSALVVRLLAKDPADRPQTAAEVAAELARIGPDPAPRADPRRPRRAVRVAAGLAFAALLVAGGVVLVRIRGKDGKETTVEVPPGGKATVTAGPGATVTVENPAGDGPKPPADPPGSADLNAPAARKAMDWVTNAGGAVELTVPGVGGVRYTAGGPLPAGTGPVSVRSLTLSDKTPYDAAAVAHLRGLPPPTEYLGFRYNTRAPDAVLQLLAETPPGLTRVREAEVSNTNVTDDGLKYFAGADNLATLRLNQSRVTGPGLKHLSRLPRLKALELAAIPGGVNGADLGHLRGVKLDRLGLKINRSVGDDAMDHLADMTSLRSLDLWQTSVSDAGIKKLYKLTGLTDFSVGNKGVKVTDAALDTILTFRDLKGLGLSLTRVTDAGVGRLAALSELEWLDLDDTAVSDAGLATLPKFTELRHLNLRHEGNSRVTDAGLVHVAGCNGLAHVRLQGSKVTPAGVQKLAAALPGCRIEWDGGVIEGKPPAKK